MKSITYGRFLGTFNRIAGDGAAALKARRDTRDATAIFLKESPDFDIDEFAKPGMRKGRSLVSANRYHSLPRSGEPMLGVRGGNLYLLQAEPVFRETFLAAVGDMPMSYADFLGRRYMTNDGIIRYYADGTLQSIPDPSERYMRPLPPGHIIRKWNNRLLLGKFNMVAWSEVGADYYDTRSDRSFWKLGASGRVTMIEPVTDGCYVSDESRVYFVRGDDPTDVQFETVSDAGAWEGSAFPAVDVKIEQQDQKAHFKQAVYWCSKNGVFVGGDSGQVINLTEDWYIMPTADRGAGVFYKNIPGLLDRYQCVLNP